MLAPLTTQIVGSYTKPKWLIRYERAFRFDESAWRVERDARDQALDDAVCLAVFDQERAGLDLLTDGEARRVAYDRYIYAKLDGIDSKSLGRREMPQALTPVWRATRANTVEERNKVQTELPRVVAPVKWREPITVGDLEFAKKLTSRPLKATIVGPLTIMSRILDEYYGDEKRLIHALASALNKELRALQDAGTSVLHVDEPIFHFFPEKAEKIGMAAIEELADGISVPLILNTNYGSSYGSVEKRPHDGYRQVLSIMSKIVGIDAISLEYEEPGYTGEMLTACGDKHVVLGLLNLGKTEIETPEHIAARIRDALKFVPLERLHPTNDGGFWHVQKDVAFAKMKALVDGTQIIRSEYKAELAARR
ncbi:MULTISPECIES: hypothetical protein [unclassified Bradyrhizobium]|uniref:hypothetical protein n=1 Tax=unclassified Bradyrhizobium TaxID=2631580 RepID=UPI0033940583